MFQREELKLGSWLGERKAENFQLAISIHILDLIFLRWERQTFWRGDKPELEKLITHSPTNPSYPKIAPTTRKPTTAFFQKYCFWRFKSQSHIFENAASTIPYDAATACFKIRKAPEIFDVAIFSFLFSASRTALRQIEFPPHHVYTKSMHPIKQIQWRIWWFYTWLSWHVNSPQYVAIGSLSSLRKVPENGRLWRHQPLSLARSRSRSWSGQRPKLQRGQIFGYSHNREM